MNRQYITNISDTIDVENMKSEARNTKQILNSNVQMFQTLEQVINSFVSVI